MIEFCTLDFTDLKIRTRINNTKTEEMKFSIQKQNNNNVDIYVIRNRICWLLLLLISVLRLLIDIFLLINEDNKDLQQHFFALSDFIFCWLLSNGG